MEVLVMPDSSNYRDLKLRYRYSQVVIVKARQIRLRTTSPENKDSIETAIFPNLFQRVYNRRWSLLSLHHGFEKDNIEVIATVIVLKVVTKISKAGCRLSRNHGQAPWKTREGQLFLHIHIALFLELLNGLFLLKSLLSYGKCRIYVIDK